MRDRRRKEIAAYITRRGSVTMPELCETFHVSMNTIRADVSFLEQTGTVEKVYGGVRTVQQQEIPLFAQRAQLHTEAKRAIVRQAASLVNDGDTLFVDAGTTTMHLLDMLPLEVHATIVTGNLHIIAQAYTRPNLELIVLPGALNRRTNSVSDVSTLEFLGRYHFGKALMAATGLSADGKLNVSSYLDHEIKHLAVQQSDHRILLCDSAKFGAAGLMSYASLKDMDRLITDTHLHTTHVSRCGQLEAQEIVAGYKAAGYSALIVTDHFNRTTFDYLGLDPAGKGDRVGAFLEGYRRVREEGERQGLRVFKGAELRFDECENDYLLYGWADELLAEPEEIFRMGIAAFSPIARGQGALLIQAHPYRHGCTPAIARYLDGVEIYNASPRHDSRDALAVHYAKEFGLIGTAGSDCHRNEDIARAGIGTERLPSDSMEMMRLLRSRNFRLLKNGEVFEP